MTQLKLGEFGFAVGDFGPGAADDAAQGSEASPPTAVGVVRVGKKILVDGAWSLARHTSYAAALAGLRISGVSIGVSHGTADPSEALSATVAALAELPVARRWALAGGKGVPSDALATLGTERPAPGHAELDHWGAIATVASLSAALGDLSGLTFRLTSASTAASALADELAAAGVSNTADDAADVVVIEGTASAFDHHSLEGLSARALLPVGVNVVSPRAVANAARASIVVVPDFCAEAGRLLGRYSAPEGASPDAIASFIGSTIAQRYSESVGGEGIATDTSFYLASCERAEAFMSTWQPTLPDARPIG